MSETTIETTTEPDSSPDAPAVVVVDTGDDTGGNGDDGQLVEIAATVGALVERMNALETRVQEAQTTAEIADSTSRLAAEVADAAGQSAAEVAEEVATDAELEEIAEDVPPQATPWFARSMSEWKGSGTP